MGERRVKTGQIREENRTEECEAEELHTQSESERGLTANVHFLLHPFFLWAREDCDTINRRH